MKYSIMFVYAFSRHSAQKLEGKINMYQTLMNLYYGNLDFQKRTREQLPLEQYHSKEYDRIKNHLETMLDEDGKKLLNELLDAHVDGSDGSSIDAFTKGFRVATMLMVEVYYDNDNLLENKEQYLRNFLHRPFVATPSTLDKHLAKK